MTDNEFKALLNEAESIQNDIENGGMMMALTHKARMIELSKIIVAESKRRLEAGE